MPCLMTDRQASRSTALATRNMPHVSQLKPATGCCYGTRARFFHLLESRALPDHPERVCTHWRFKLKRPTKHSPKPFSLHEQGRISWLLNSCKADQPSTLKARGDYCLARLLTGADRIRGILLRLESGSYFRSDRYSRQLRF